MSSDKNISINFFQLNILVLMLIKNCSKLFNRRCRRYYLLNIFLFFLFSFLFIQIKHNTNFSLSRTTFINSTSCPDILSNKTILNCSGDPLKQWCENELNLCNSSLIIYKNLFFVTRSVILQTKFATGKRLGGEDIEAVLNQPEQDEYFNFNKEFIKVIFIYLL